MGTNIDREAVAKLLALAGSNGLDISGGQVRRSSSRFCFGVEHGDYNGTELFGVGTDRFIWLAYKPNGTDKVRLFSGNFPDDGLVQFPYGDVPGPLTVKDSWARFPYGVDYVLSRNGLKLEKGFDAVIYGNIPGGGMSRSASLTLNLILTMLEVNGIPVDDDLSIIDWAQAVENDYIGSPCGQLDQIMIYFAKAGMGTHYDPASRSVSYVQLGEGATDFRIVGLDTGTVRPGLEKSTYKIRRAECEELVEMARAKGFEITCLADVRDEKLYKDIVAEFAEPHRQLCERLRYIYKAQKRFYKMMDAWKAGDIEGVGAIFRQDGYGLRDEYDISGPELEEMCEIARTVEGVFGERMLGGGDKGASGAIVRADSVDALREAVDIVYPVKYPEFADKYAVHACRIVDGIVVLDGKI